jgi:Transposase DDE domain
MPKTPSPKTPRKKTQYRVRNWAEYDQALVQRGALTVWVAEDLAATWRYTGPKRQGAQPDYSDGAILMVLTLKELLHLTNRQAEGFVRSLFSLLHLDLAVPDHTTLSRRGGTLRGTLAAPTPAAPAGALTLVFDSTGLKVYGEGEWKVRAHGYSKRRTWRKLHLALNPTTGHIEAAELTENGVTDAEAIGPLLAQLPTPIATVAADGAYDKRPVYDQLTIHSPAAILLIPPRQDARIWQHGNTEAPPLPRDENLRAIRKQGRRAWKEQSGYHVRSLAETAMFRLKNQFGDKLSARSLATQATQVMCRCQILNRMTTLGRPQSYKLA